MKEPQKWYSIRLNLTKFHEDVNSQHIIQEINEFANNYTNGIIDSHIPNLYFLGIKGPFPFHTHEKKILIDRFAAESVMIGANLYMPGFITKPTDLALNEEISMLGPANIHVANGISRFNSNSFNNANHGLAIETTESLYQMPPYRTSELYANGYFSDQIFSSLIACWILMSLYETDKQILDMCSAPGHKTCALSEMGFYLNNGKYPRIISVDRSSNRLQNLRDEILRLKLENIQIYNLKIQKLAERHPEIIGANDLVVLDPPCSALGTRPKIMIDIRPKIIAIFFSPNIHLSN
jgi:16S rRNA (cytosine967-C5)-methyltransferase